MAQKASKDKYEESKETGSDDNKGKLLMKIMLCR